MDAFEENIEGARQLVSAKTNKTNVGNGNGDEGVVGDLEDVLTLKMEDSELLELKAQWEIKSAPYIGNIKPRQDNNKLYYRGKQKQGTTQKDIPVSSNLIFESEETFIPQALSKNPEPVVWSDNTVEGKDASNDVKTMLQFHADVLCLRRKLGVMVRHWSIYFLGVVKHGWDSKVNDITTEIRKPQNFILDPDGYIDEFGNYVGAYLGERIESTAQALIDDYPDAKVAVVARTDGKLGTSVVRTEWWTNEFCFTTFEDQVLDKHKNEFFKYDEEEELEIEGVMEKNVIKGHNHFAKPMMPYTFLSVFSLQESPHDITNLIEQNIPNQDRINDRDDQITKNLRQGNNSIIVSDANFTIETAKQAAQAMQDGDPILATGGNIDQAIKRLPANDIPSAVFTSQENDKNTLRSVFGVQGLSAQKPNEDTTARGMILNQNHDSTRIGGGIGDALEQVADNIFNWWVQLYYVFYDEDHFGAIMGNGRAIEYVKLQLANTERRFVVSVSPNSMQPKDEITEMNLAIDLANKGWLDPINLFKKMNYPDPMETAKMVTMFRLNPQMYFQTFFPEEAQAQQIQTAPNPLDVQPGTGEGESTLSAPESSSALSQVPISTPSMPT